MLHSQRKSSEPADKVGRGFLGQLGLGSQGGRISKIDIWVSSQGLGLEFQRQDGVTFR